MEGLSQDRAEIFLPLLMSYSECRDFILKMLQKRKFEEDDFLSNTYNLLKFIAERSVTVSLLIQHNCLWDAQIIMRTVLEASLKLFYLCNCPEAERENRLKEYLFDLQEINSLKQSETAKKILDAFKEENDFTLQFKPMVLDEELERELKAKWNRKARQALEQKWSFSEILAKQIKELKEFDKILIGLVHPYKLSSHLIHADETGIGIIAERSRRAEIDKYKVELHHFCSLMKYSTDNFFLCAQVLCLMLNEDSKVLRERYDALKPVFAKIAVYSRDVFQDSSYDKFR